MTGVRQVSIQPPARSATWTGAGAAARGRGELHSRLKHAAVVGCPGHLRKVLTVPAHGGAERLPWLYQFRRQKQAAQEQAAAVIALTTEQGIPIWRAVGTILRGRALVEQGRSEEGVAEMHQGLASYWATGAELIRPYWLALLAEGYAKLGRPEDGLSTLAEALTVAQSTGERWWEAELYRLKGELALRLGEPTSALDSVEACFRQALDIARRQQAKSLELRTAVSLACLWQSQGKG